MCQGGGRVSGFPIIMPPHSLSEIFGFPFDNQSDLATRYRGKRLCPFNNNEPWTHRERRFGAAAKSVQVSRRENMARPTNTKMDA